MRHYVDFGKSGHIFSTYEIYFTTKNKLIMVLICNIK